MNFVEKIHINTDNKSTIHQSIIIHRFGGEKPGRRPGPAPTLGLAAGNGVHFARINRRVNGRLDRPTGR